VTGGFSVWISALRTSSAEWNDQAEELRGVRRALDDGSSHVAELGPRVAPAAEAFFDTWVEGLTSRLESAAAHSLALSDAAAAYDVTDAAQSQRLAQLWSWDQRDLRPEG
jgi:hypothetical protein